MSSSSTSQDLTDCETEITILTPSITDVVISEEVIKINALNVENLDIYLTYYQISPTY